MHAITTDAMILRRTALGDFDLIVRFLTPQQGKISALVKYAKKSRRRFAGLLELFSRLDIVCHKGRGDLPILTEAVLHQPFAAIRGDFIKTAYASYWAELIDIAAVEGQNQEALFALLYHVLCALDHDAASAAALSVLFQVRFLNLTGLTPHLSGCMVCHTPIDALAECRLFTHPHRGGLVCGHCGGRQASAAFRLSKGTIKQFQWIDACDLNVAGRIRFSAPALKESLSFLEYFVPYHIGRTPRSLVYLKEIRS